MFDNLIGRDEEVRKKSTLRILSNKPRRATPGFGYRSAGEA